MSEIIIALNKLVALFSVAGYNLRAAKYAFREAGLQGFTRLVKNEEKERWELQDNLIKICYDLGISVILEGIPAPHRSWDSPLESLKVLIATDCTIMDFLEKIQKLDISAELSYNLAKLTSHLRSECIEIQDVMDELSITSSLYDIDQSLYVRYGKKHCCAKY